MSIQGLLVFWLMYQGGGGEGRTHPRFLKRSNFSKYLATIPVNCPPPYPIGDPAVGAGREQRAAAVSAPIPTGKAVMRLLFVPLFLCWVQPIVLIQHLYCRDCD